MLQLESDGLPEVWLINAALEHSADRAELPWHLSVIIELKDVHATVLFPTSEEQKLLTSMREALEARLTANGNAVFLGSITWNGTRQLLYRVRDAEVASATLASVVADASTPRAMEYRMEQDPAWTHAERYLGAVRAAAASNVPRARLVREGGTVRVVDE